MLCASSYRAVTVTTLHRGLRPALRQSLDESHDSLFSLSYDAYIEFLQSKGRRSRRPLQPQPQPSQKKYLRPNAT
jgi:hypothetical protein